MAWFVVSCSRIDDDRNSEKTNLLKTGTTFNWPFPFSQIQTNA